MKHTLRVVFLLLSFIIVSISLFAVSPKREFRATYLTTGGVDWPDKKITSGTTSQINAQKAEITTFLDKMKAANLNAVVFHVRPYADAFYQSNLVPWSHYLTGTRGKNPGYDPLAYAIQEAHKRGIELHAWFNPYRHMTTTLSNQFSDPIKSNHPSWLISYNSSSYKGTWLDPGNPEVRAHVVAVVQEVVEKYDIDGVVFDDYFYPYGGTTSQDYSSKSKYKPSGQSDADWRRANVDKMVAGVYNMIQSKKPWVRFGIAPFGNYSTQSSAYSKYGLSSPGCSTLDAYNVIYCNTLEWMKTGTVDYVAPQLYWSTSSSGKSFTTLSQWWANAAQYFSNQLGSKKVHFFASHLNDAIDGQSRFSNWEMGNQVDKNRSANKQNAPGSIFFATDAFFSTSYNLHTYLKTNKFTQLSLPPAMDWKATTALSAPTNLSLSGTTLSWSHPSATRFTVYAYPKGTDKAAALANSSYLLGVVYGKSCSVSGVSSLSSKTLAVCAYDRYGNEYTAALYNADSNANNTDPEPPVTPTTGLTASKMSLSFTGVVGQTPQPYEDIKIVGNSLTSTIYVNPSTSAVTVETLSDWNNKTGGTVRVKLNTTKAAGSYSGYVAVQSGSYRIEINVTVTITDSSTPPTTDPNQPVSGSVKISTLWTKTASAAGLSLKDANRSMAYYNGSLYIPNKDNGTFLVFSASNGNKTATQTIGTASFWQHNLRITDDGQMLLGNTDAATVATASIDVYTSSCSAGGQVQQGSAVMGARSDYFYSYGKWNESGYLIALSNTGKALKIPFANGVLGTATSINNSTLPVGISGKAIPDGTTAFYANASTQIPTKHSLSTGALLEQFGSDKPATVKASGMAVCTIRGNKYMITPADIYGGFDIFTITNGLASAKKVISTTAPLGSNENNAATIDFCTYVSGNDAYIYVLAPNNGIAAYKLTFTPTSTSAENVVEENVTILPTWDGVQIDFIGEQPITIFTMSGAMICQDVAFDSYTCSLSQGGYIIRVGNKTYKFIK